MSGGIMKKVCEKNYTRSRVRDTYQTLSNPLVFRRLSIPLWFPGIKAGPLRSLFIVLGAYQVATSML